jgi:hypothetical protein
LIYVAATTQVVSATIVVKRREEGHALLIQRLVYFISEVLSETKICYPQIQKLLYAVILTRRKLRHYFESHPVTVVSWRTSWLNGSTPSYQQLRSNRNSGPCTSMGR